MNEIIVLTGISISGFLLGIFFFGGLWFTVSNGLLSKSPALWFTISLLVRVTAVVTGFYYLSSGHWERLMACLLGFVIARIAVTKWTRQPSDKANQREHKM